MKPSLRPRVWISWLPVLLYAGAIFINSSGPSAVTLPPFPHADKLAHLAAYALMGWLVLRALVITLNQPPTSRLFLAAALIAALYGASDELHQGLVPARDSSLADLAADGLGSVLGAWLFGRVHGKTGGKQ